MDLYNVEHLTALIASYEADVPHTGEFADPEYYPRIDVEAWKNYLTAPHWGDCNKQPQPCARCAAEEYRHFAE